MTPDPEISYPLQYFPHFLHSLRQIFLLPTLTNHSQISNNYTEHLPHRTNNIFIPIPQSAANFRFADEQEVEIILSKVDNTTIGKFQVIATASYSTFSVMQFAFIEEDDWNVVVMETKSLAAEWEEISICLGLPFDLIKGTKSVAGDCYQRWSEALSQWIRQNYNTKKFGDPSWRTLLKAIAGVDKRKFKKLAADHPQSEQLEHFKSSRFTKLICFTIAIWYYCAGKVDQVESEDRGEGCERSTTNESEDKECEDIGNQGGYIYIN